ncbi:MAG: S41 family peptidase [Clostridia bacterium]|nr:S41 family peptidase [Clostridia bacterium]
MEEKKGIQTYKVVMLVILSVFLTFLFTSIGINRKNANGGIQQQATSFLDKYISNDKSDLDNKIEKCRRVIDKYFLGEINEEKLIDSAAKGYVAGLDDPYTEYISKEDMKAYTENIMGNFVGIGIYMVKNTEANLVEVLSPIKNSPAEQVGIQPGDLIKSVDGVQYTADDLNTMSSKIKGEEGTVVKLEIIRGNETLNFDITRTTIKVNQIEGEVLENNIGYIEIPSFDEDTAKDFKAKFEELQKQNIKSLIIDLRNNGGGIVNESLQIAKMIADKGSTLLYTVDKNNREKVEKSNNDPIIKMPIVILVNENSASASEILTGALKDLGKATIIGTKTYGKGVIQNVLTLDDGSGIKVTSEEYQTPNRNKINKVGIEPDETVELPETVKNILQVEKEEDTQLKKAIEKLK